jgi:tol-pal system protein YbgF
VLARPKLVALSIALIACTLASGCFMTKQEGAELRTASDENQKRISELETEVRAKQLALESRLAEMQQGLESARALLTRDSADVGVQVQQQQEKLAVLEGKLDEITHNLTDLIQQSAKARVELDERLAKLGTAKPGETPVAAGDVPADRPAHFAAAYEAYKAGDHDKARGLFKEYLTRYPTDEKAGDAQYWIGASYLVQNKPATALGEYRKVISTYPNSPAVDTALYGMSDAFYRLHACTDAKGALDALLKRKPSKALEERAKELQRALKDAAPGYCTS